MKFELEIGKPAACFVTTLCHHGDWGDFQAFPDRPLYIDFDTAVPSLRAAGALRMCGEATRIQFHFRGARVTLFKSGRLLMEGVRPDRTAAAAEMAALLIISALRSAPALTQ